MRFRLFIMNSAPFFYALLLLIFLSRCQSAKPSFHDEWSQYRGPNGAGISLSTARIQTGSSDKLPHQVWKRSIGDGFSGIVLSGDQLIVAFGEDSSEYLAGFNRTNGDENWRCPIGKLFVEEFGDGPRGTPAVDGDQAFIYNSWGHLYSVDIRTGGLLWEAALTDQFEIPMIEPRRGFTTSPLIIDDKVIIYTGGMDSTAFMALNKITGEVMWRTGSTRGSYSSPVVAVIYGVKQILFTTTRVIETDEGRKGIYNVVSISPDGEKLWEGPGLPGVVAMPVFVAPDKVFISSSVEIGSKLIQVHQEGDVFNAKEVWSNKNLRNHFNSSVYYEGYIYGFSNATLECLDAATSERKWRKRGFGKGSLIVADNKLLILSDKGKLGIAEATSEEYKELAKAQVIKGKSWTSPSFADGKLYLRNRKEMACYDLTK